MVRPRPIPPRLISLDFAKQPKNWNSFYKSYSVMPIPESVTSDTSHPSSKVTLTAMYPLKVNLEAFPRRLKRTCLYLLRSV